MDGGSQCQHQLLLLLLLFSLQLFSGCYQAADSTVSLRLFIKGVADSGPQVFVSSVTTKTVTRAAPQFHSGQSKQTHSNELRQEEGTEHLEQPHTAQCSCPSHRTKYMN